MNNIKKVLVGSLVGIGSILPGVSGGMIAAAFNIYGQLIEALNNFFKHPIAAVKSIWQYLIGVLIGILIGFIGLKLIFDHVPIPSTLLFIGLILGTLPEIWFQAKQKKIDALGFVIIGITMIVMIGILFLPIGANQNPHWYTWVTIGALIATSLIVPGLSGTMILLMIGYYQVMLNFVDQGLNALRTFNFNTLWQMMPQVLWILLGALLAVFILVKSMIYILKKKPQRFYQVVLGIMIASPINIIGSLYLDLKEEMNIFDFAEQWPMWVIGLILIPVGIYISRLFSKGNNETEENQTSDN